MEPHAQGASEWHGESAVRAVMLETERLSRRMRTSAEDNVSVGYARGHGFKFGIKHNNSDTIALCREAANSRREVPQSGSSAPSLSTAPASMDGDGEDVAEVQQCDALKVEKCDEEPGKSKGVLDVGGLAVHDVAGLESVDRAEAFLSGEAGDVERQAGDVDGDAALVSARGVQLETGSAKPMNNTQDVLTNEATHLVPKTKAIPSIKSFPRKSLMTSITKSQPPPTPRITEQRNSIQLILPPPEPMSILHRNEHSSVMLN